MTHRPPRTLLVASLAMLLLAAAACSSDPIAADAGPAPDAPVAPDVSPAIDAPAAVDAPDAAVAPPDAAVAPPDAAVAVDAPAPTLPVSHDVRIIVEPSDHGAALVAAIRGARRSVHMTMYLLSNREVIAALVDAQARGLEVQVVLNRTIPGGATPNDGAYASLTQAGVSVRWAPSRFTYTHEKCVVLDGAEAWIMTMNATGSAPDANREYLAVDREPDDVRDAEAIFRADFAGAAYPTYAGRLLVSPLNAQASMVALVNTATRTIDIESEELEDRTTGRALQARLRAHVAVRVVLPDGTPSASAARTIADLVAAGATIVTVRSPVMHAKAVVIDGVRAYVGSANLGYTSLTANRELGVLFDAPAEVRRVADTIAADFASGRPF